MKLDGLMWWIPRWRKSSAFVEMNLEQQGAYRNLLDEATLRGGVLPRDEKTLAKACGDPRRWPKVRDAVMKHFALGEDGWRNETLDEVLKESTKRMEKRTHWRTKKGNGKHD